MPKKTEKRVRAWADVGSHGGIFAFSGGGQCAENYKGMMHIYNEKVTSDLIPVMIVYKFPPSQGKGKKKLK